jgi:hypothetical protein
MRKVVIILVAVMLIGVIAAAGCTTKTENNQIVLNSTNTTNTSTTTQTTTAVKATLKPSATSTPIYPTYIPLSTPTPTPSVTPTPPVTGSFGQSTYVVANGTVITATVSNWRSNPDVALGLSTNHAPVPMQPIGNGVYSYTLEGVVIIVHGTGSGGISLWDNGVIVAYANTTWTNP